MVLVVVVVVGTYGSRSSLRRVSSLSLAVCRLPVSLPLSLMLAFDLTLLLAAFVVVFDVPFGMEVSASSQQRSVFHGVEFQVRFRLGKLIPGPLPVGCLSIPALYLSRDLRIYYSTAAKKAKKKTKQAMINHIEIIVSSGGQKNESYDFISLCRGLGFL